MELIEPLPIVYPKIAQKVYIHNFTDIHMGAVGCDREQLRKDIRALRQRADEGETHRWFLGGDCINGIGPKDKRHDSTAVAAEFQQFSGKSLFQRQARAVVEEFKPIQEMGLFVGAGNHETKVAKTCDFDPAEYIAEGLNLPYAGYTCGFKLLLQPQNNNTNTVVFGVWHHGWGGGRTVGSKANLAEALHGIIKNAHMYFVGHVHTPITVEDADLYFAERGPFRVKRKERLMLVGASYLKAYPLTQSVQTGGVFDPDRNVHSDYAEQKGYRPTIIGHNGAEVGIERLGITEGQQYHLRIRAVRF